MPTDQVVDARDVLRAIQQVKRSGLIPLVAQLEALEPDLIEYFLDETTAIHTRLAGTGTEARQVQQIHQQVQIISLVMILALGSGYRRLIGVEEPTQPTPPQHPPAHEPEAGA